MIYVSSDWHGWPLEKIEDLLERAGFGEDDYLFVLGDVIDRGDHGVELLRWLTWQTNVQLILGNHEAMLLACFSLLQSEDADKYQAAYLMKNWMENGGGPTLEGLEKLVKENEDEAEDILGYLQDAPLYDTVEVNGKDYILVHSGIGNFDPGKDLDDYKADDFLWTRPDLNTTYYQNATVIFGHTPTEYFGEQYLGKPVYTDSWICIDTGTGGGRPPVLLRLDDMKEFY